MATKAEYEAIAPYVMSIGDFSATAIENKLSAIPEPPEPEPVPDPTKANVIALFNTLYTDYFNVIDAIRDNGGLVQIASDHNMTFSQCKRCIRDFEAMRILYENPVEE